MPNLNQIYALKQQFSQLSEADQRVKDFLEKSEAKDILIKGFETARFRDNLNETKLFSFINENLNPNKPDLIKYFDEGREEDVALLFIDITSFSKTISGWSNTEMKLYLDNYYKKIIPIIYKNGGEIEKLMGDGIICVFGKPFLALPNPEYVYNAEKCAEEVIKEFYGTNKNVKVAIHTGVVNYYKVPGEHYGEYTIIGQPITDLYRLEGVSEGNSINYFSESPYDKLGWIKSIFNMEDIYHDYIVINKLQGVNYKAIQTIQFPEYL